MLQNSTLSDLYDYHHRVCHHAVTEGKQPRLGTWGIMILSKFKLIQVYSGYHYQLVFVWFFKMFYHVLLLQNLKAKNQALQASITRRWSTGSQWEDFLSTVTTWLQADCSCGGCYNEVTVWTGECYHLCSHGNNMNIENQDVWPVEDVIADMTTWIISTVWSWTDYIHYTLYIPCIPVHQINRCGHL